MIRPWTGPGPADAASLRAEADPALFYEIHQEWPAPVTRAVAEYLGSALATGAPRRSLFLGAATGVNDVLPFARLAAPADRIVGSDVVPAYLERLRDHARREGLANVEARVVDVRRPSDALGTFDLVTLLFVIHRIPSWRDVVGPLAGLVVPGGSFYTSEFAGPCGVIYRSNENGAGGDGPVGRLIRRYFELLPERFSPELKSTNVRPFLEALGRELTPAGSVDFHWPQSLTVGDMFRKIESGAYAPYFSIRPPSAVLEQIQSEYASDWSTRSDLLETIRIYRFTRGE